MLSEEFDTYNEGLKDLNKTTSELLSREIETIVVSDTLDSALSELTTTLTKLNTWLMSGRDGPPPDVSNC